MSNTGHYDANTLDILNLSDLARQGLVRKPQRRQACVEQIAELLNGHQSVLLIGPTGIGKTAVVHGVVHHHLEAESDDVFRLSSLDMNDEDDSPVLGHKKMAALLNMVRKKEAVLYIVDFWHLVQHAQVSNEASASLTALIKCIREKGIRVVAEMTDERARKLNELPGFDDLFVHLNVPLLHDAEIRDLLLDRAKGLDIELSDDALATLMALPVQFQPSLSPPTGALQLLDNVCDYQQEKSRIGEPVPIDASFIERVFAIYSGRPLFLVSPRTKISANDIRAWFQGRLIGQHEAIEAVVNAITLFKSGLNNRAQPIGAFLFVGPTGVGKTELARALSQYLFGRMHRLLRFDLSLFSDAQAVERLVGSTTEPSLSSQLLDPVRTNPFQVILFDNVEHANAGVLEVLGQILNTGQVTPPVGRSVNFTNTVIICTSSIGASEAEKSLGFDVASKGLSREEKIQSDLKAVFQPEWLRSFQRILVFHTLAPSQLRRIARQELRNILLRDGITSRELVVDIDETAIHHVIEHGLDERYGARALKRELQSRIVMPLAMTLMEKSPEPGSVLSVKAIEGQIRVLLTDTPEGRARPHLRSYSQSNDQHPRTKSSLFSDIATIQDRIESLADNIDEPFHLRERERLLDLRQDQAFWRDTSGALQDLKELDRINESITRLENLRERMKRLESEIEDAHSEAAIDQAGHQTIQLNESVTRVHRELVTLGPHGRWDAILTIEPVGAMVDFARDLLVEVYGRWAASQHYEVDWVCAPRSESDPCTWMVKGHYAFGFLTRETGLHRIRRGKASGTLRVSVRPIFNENTEGDIRLVEHRAIKGDAAYGQRVRSRLVCENGLILQNHRTIAENTEFARALASSWRPIRRGPIVVRHYDLDPLRLRDPETEWTSSRTDALAPHTFHELLVRRIDALQQPHDE